MSGRISGMLGKISGMPGRISDMTGKISGMLGRISSMPSKISGMLGRISSIPGSLLKTRCGSCQLTLIRGIQRSIRSGATFITL